MTTSSLARAIQHLARAFPPPAYLAMPAVGIDISDYAIKYAMFPQSGPRLPLHAYGKIDLPLDVIDHGEIRDTKTITKHLARLKEEHGFAYAHLSLPEEHAYLFQLDLEARKGESLEQMLEFHLKENVPLSADEALYDYTTLRTKDSVVTLNVSVYPVAIASQYISAVEEGGIRVLSTEIEGQSTTRALIENTSTNATLVVDIGRNDSNVSISTQGVVTFTASVEIGGDDLTRSVARSLDVSFQKAEQLKRTHGFRDTDESSLVYNALLPKIKDLTETIRRHLMYWQMHMRTASGAGKGVARIVIAGGSANMAGLPEYIEALLGVPVEVGSVWQNVYRDTTDVPVMPANESLEYAAAIGLALRSVHHNE